MPSNFDLADLLSLQDVEKCLEKAFPGKTRLKVLQFSLNSFTDEKIGFLGSHRRLKVSYKSDNGPRKSVSFFFKSVPYEIASQSTYILEKGVFRKEVTFLQRIVPLMTKDFRAGLWCPECYLGKDDLLVLEDLKSRGYAMRGKLFNERQTLSVLHCLARFHGSSILAEARNGRTFLERFPEALEETSFTRDGLTNDWFTAGVRLVVSVAREMGLRCERIPEACERIYEAIKPSRTKTNVICHGDLWGNNFLFDQDERNCLLVDFQIIRYCVPTQDVVQFLYLCVDPEVRRRRERKFLEYYHKVLTEVLEQHEFGNRLVPTWREILEGVEEQRLGAIITAAIFFPTVLMDGMVMAELMKDPEDYSRYTYGDRSETVLRIMKTDENYAWRIRDVVRELVECSLKLDQLPVPS